MLSLSDDELERYSRQIVFSDIGYTGQLKLRNAKVCIIGVGGLGCPIATQLTAMGVGYLRLVDRDVVEQSNLHRQYLYDMKSLGYPKVEVAAKKLKALNPDVEIETLSMSLNVDNAVEIIKGVDIVIDGLDSMETRYAINRACVKLKIPYVFGAAIMNYGNLSTIIPGETPCLECFFPDIKDETLPTCGTAGVHPSVLGIVSSLQVSEATKIIVGRKPNLIDKLLIVDLEKTSLQELDITRMENCPVCGIKPGKDPQQLKRKFVEETCGRSGKRTFVIVPKENLELNIKKLYRFLKKRGADISVNADLGLTFLYDQNVYSSILKSGVMIVKGLSGEKDAIKIYSNIIKDGLNIPWSRIE
ncbi:HesA/MoeB/ThiF family protein [Candidatus Bathyarchaeota archaeon]|nr:HesA/MoeB/ThiF family protein [Candidatus Bathyarchaeota archaeon]